MGVCLYKNKCRHIVEEWYKNYHIQLEVCCIYGCGSASITFQFPFASVMITSGPWTENTHRFWIKWIAWIGNTIELNVDIFTYKCLRGQKWTCIQNVCWQRGTVEVKGEEREKNKNKAESLRITSQVNLCILPEGILQILEVNIRTNYEVRNAGKNTALFSQMPPRLKKDHIQYLMETV